MKGAYRIIEVSSDTGTGAAWQVVRQLSDDATDVQDISRHPTKAEAEASKADQEQLDAGG